MNNARQPASISAWTRPGSRINLSPRLPKRLPMRPCKVPGAGERLMTVDAPISRHFGLLQAGPVSALARGRASVLCLGILQLRRSPVRARRSSKNAGVIVRELRLTVAVWVPWVALAPLDSSLAHTKADLTLFDFKGGICQGEAEVGFYTACRVSWSRRH